MKHVFAVLIFFLAMSMPLSAQTTSYTIPTGSTCSNIEGCIYHPDGLPNDGYARFQTDGNGGLNQFVLSADSTNPNNAVYCNLNGNDQNSTAVWNVAATPALGPTAYLYTLDCNPVSNLDSQPAGSIHTEIFAYSQVKTYVCGGRVRTICKKTVWTVTDGSFVEKIN